MSKLTLSEKIFRITQAIYKALTGSRKYFYVTVFNLKFGDEPEEVQRSVPNDAAS